MTQSRLLAGAPASLGVIAKCIGPIEEEIRFGVDVDELERRGVGLEAMREALAFLIFAARDAYGTDEERCELLAEVIGADWEAAYARGLPSSDVINRLAFALAREIEEKLFDIAARGPKGEI